MTAEQMALYAGVLLSLVFSYVPGLNVKFAGLSTEVKRLIMLGLLVVVGGGAYALACIGLGNEFSIGIACTKEGATQLVQAFITAAIANQVAYGLSPQTAAVKEAKELRTAG